MNQSLPPFSHFTSLLLLCIFPFIVKIEICSCPLSVLPITLNEQALICSLPTSICSLCVFIGALFFAYFFLFTIFSNFFTCYHTLPRPSPLRQLHPVLPVLPNSSPDMFSTTSKQFPVPRATCWLPSLSPPSQATMHGWWHPASGKFCLG